MRRTLCIVMLIAAAATGCSRSTPEQRTINDAATALGGRDRLLAVKTLVIEGLGTQGNLGQDLTPESTLTSFNVADYKRTIDVAAGRVRTEFTRAPNFRYFAGQTRQKQVTGVDAAVGYNIAADGTATRVPDQTASDRRAEIYHHPVTSVRAALEQGATVTNARSENGQDLVDVKTAGGVAYTLAIDSATKLPARVRSMSDNTNLGDVIVETVFGDYQATSGLQLPTHLTTKTDTVTAMDIRVQKQSVDAEAGDLAAPAAAASAPVPPAAAPANVVVQPLAKGIWFLGGQSHHSVLVEFTDHLTLIEAPQNDVRALAVIAKARELVPGKPLNQLVMSHHHFDHSGGVRAAIAEGLTVVVHKNAAAYIEAAAKRPHTLVPDALARNAKPARVEAVDGQRVLTDGKMTVNLYAISDSAHTDTMLMAYFPRERLLVEADMFTPGAPVAPFVNNLLENITARKLQIDRIVPLHGAVAPFSELMKTVRATVYPGQEPKSTN